MSPSAQSPTASPVIQKIQNLAYEALVTLIWLPLLLFPSLTPHQPHPSSQQTPPSKLWLLLSLQPGILCPQVWSVRDMRDMTCSSSPSGLWSKDSNQEGLLLPLPEMATHPSFCLSTYFPLSISFFFFLNIENLGLFIKLLQKQNNYYLEYCEDFIPDSLVLLQK